MSYDLIAVLLIGHPDAEIASKFLLPHTSDIEADDFDCLVVENDRDLATVVAKQRSQVVFTFGSLESYANMHAAPLEIRRRWLHFDVPPAPRDLALAAVRVFVDVSTNDRFPERPLVSVFTPTYSTGEKLRR